MSYLSQEVEAVLEMPFDTLEERAEKDRAIVNLYNSSHSMRTRFALMSDMFEAFYYDVEYVKEIIDSIYKQERALSEMSDSDLLNLAESLFPAK